jgi:hypothetical protein
MDPRRKSTIDRRQKEGGTTQEKIKVFARYPMTARKAEEKHAMLATNGEVNEKERIRAPECAGK